MRTKPPTYSNELMQRMPRGRSWRIYSLHRRCSTVQAKVKTCAFSAASALTHFPHVDVMLRHLGPHVEGWGLGGGWGGGSFS